MVSHYFITIGPTLETLTSPDFLSRDVYKRQSLSLKLVYLILPDKLALVCYKSFTFL